MGPDGSKIGNAFSGGFDDEASNVVKTIALHPSIHYAVEE